MQNGIVLALTLALLGATTAQTGKLSMNNDPVQKPYATPQEVWAGIDPRKDPLDVELKREWTEDGIAYREFYFTGEIIAGEPVRVYAMYAAPVGAKSLPAVLHIHGGGQTVSQPWLAFWAKRGYAAMTFNWGGRWENRTEFTRWGAFPQGNHLDANAGVVVHPTQRNSPWFHWALLSRRCLTYLERQPEVNPKRLGIFGISMGGTLVWPVAAMDDRVKAVCSIYGNGWVTNPTDPYAADDPKANDPDTQLWRATMQGEAYAPLIRCPVIFLSGTNDYHGTMDRTYETLARVPAPTRQAFTPNQRHHVGPEEGRDLALWMDAYLKGGRGFPATPRVTRGLTSDGVPRLTVTPDAPDTVARVDVYYALRTTLPTARHWRLADTTRQHAKWEASLPIMNPGERLFTFVNVHYTSGICLSSALDAALPTKLGAAVRATDTPSLLIDDFSNGIAGWVRQNSYTDPNQDITFLRSAIGPGGRKGVTQEPSLKNSVYIGTRKIGDPKWIGPTGASLSFLVLSQQTNTLRVRLMTNEFSPGMKTYETTVTLKPSADWQTVTLNVKQFTTSTGETLPAWSAVTTLDFNSDTWAGEQPIFSLVRWVPAE